MKRLARQDAGQLLVVRVPAKDSPETVRRYQVKQTPAVVAVRDGSELAKAEGIRGSEIESYAAYLLGKGPKPQSTPSAGAGSQAGYSRSVSGQGGHATQTGAPKVVTDATFDQEVMQSQKAVLVDFWAPWCGPCRMMEPAIEKLAHEMSNRMIVAKINVDENPYIAQRFGIQSIPTMMIVKNGQVVDRWIGALPEAGLRGHLQAHV